MPVAAPWSSLNVLVILFNDVQGALFVKSTSDCLTFDRMALFQKLEEDIFAQGLCISGNNAYLNTPIMMATLYANVSSGTKELSTFTTHS